MNMLDRITFKPLCVVTLAAAFSISAHAQNISTIAGNPGAHRRERDRGFSLLSHHGRYGYLRQRIFCDLLRFDFAGIQVQHWGQAYPGGGHWHCGLFGRWRAGHQRRAQQSLRRGSGQQRQRLYRGYRQQPHPHGGCFHGSGYTAGDIYTVAGNGTAGFLGDSGSATSAELNYPAGVAVYSSGNLYIADTDNDVIRKVDVSTDDISTVAGNGAAGYSGDGSRPPKRNLTILPAWQWTVSATLHRDSNNSVIRKVDASTSSISTVAGNGTRAIRTWAHCDQSAS